MNTSPEKQQLYVKLYEEMYQQSLLTNHTPVPPMLACPEERKNFLDWRHNQWLTLSGVATNNYREWLDHQPKGLALAETPSPSPSKK